MPISIEQILSFAAQPFRNLRSISQRNAAALATMSDEELREYKRRHDELAGVREHQRYLLLHHKRFDKSL